MIAMAVGIGVSRFVYTPILPSMLSALGLSKSALVFDRLADAGRPALSALHFAGVGVGITISAVLVAQLLASGADWAAMWQASGLISMLGTVAVGLWCRPDKKRPLLPSRQQRRPGIRGCGG
ncbi:MAG: YbfB/YjiJ family MFS transporter [Alphaproteobacteria bacterium]|nr:YbfB/YjiJ family MFS transporter [Alphaproteobacteria bacterium]